MAISALAGWLVMALAAPGAPESLRLKNGSDTVELPPLARVTYRNQTAGSWGLWGSISGNLEIAGDDFEMCLRSQGWRWHTVSFMDNHALRMRLVNLSKGSKTLLLMMWDAAAGRTAFALGEDDPDAGAGKQKTGGKI